MTRRLAAAFLLCTVACTSARAGTVVLDIPISASSDDAEQTGTAMNLTAASLALGQNVAGLRFGNVTIPPGAPITAAYVNFIASANDIQSTDVTIIGQASDSSPTFTSAASDITSRPLTVASAAWLSVPSWSTGGSNNSPSLIAIVQEIVDRPGWTSGNAMVLIITGNGRRRADSFDGNPANAAILHIEYASPGVTLTESAGSTNINETGPTSDSYTAVLDTQPTADVTLTITPDAQADLGAGAATPVALTFTSANWSTAQTITVTAVDDALIEGAHSAMITHTSSSTDSNYNGLSIPDITANVTDNDTAGVSITQTGGSTDVSELGPTSDTYTLVLDAQPTADVDIVITPDAETSVGGGGGTPILFSFTPATWNVPEVVTVTAIDDAIVEGPHSSTITHSASSADANFNAVAVANVVANVTDNDTATVPQVESAGSTLVREQGPTSDSYTLVLGSQPTANVTITVQPDGQTDLGAGGGVAIPLTFTGSTWNTPQTVVVTAVDDAAAEGPHTSTITYTLASADPAYNGLAIPNLVATVIDNDIAGVTVSQTSGSTDVAEQGPTSDTYTLDMEMAPTADVNVTVTPDSQTDVGAGPGNPLVLTFRPTNWQLTRVVTVTAVDDVVSEGPHTSTITHTASSTDANYNGLAISSVVANVTDNDTASVRIDETGGTTDVSEVGPTSDSYTVVLEKGPTSNVTVTIDPDPQTDVGAGAGNPVQLTFTTANWSTPQGVTVTAVDDAVAEGLHTSTITHTASSADPLYNGLPIASVAANVTDNDTAGVTITESAGSTDVNEAGPSSDSYTVVLDSQPTANVTVTATPDAQTTLGAGAGVPIILTFTAANWSTPQTVTVTAIDDLIDEGPHSSSITHAAVSGDANYNAIAVAGITAGITDNDTAGITAIETAGSTSVSETGPTSDSYTLQLATEPVQDVTVNVTPDVQTDLGAGAGNGISFLFTPENWNTPQTVVVTAVDDVNPEGPHSSTITHTAASGDPKYNAIAIPDIVVSVTDNDIPGITTSESGGSTQVSEQGTTSDSVTIVLDSQPTADVSITSTPDVQTDLGNGPGAPVVITFTPANWFIAQAETITAVDDAIFEGPHTSTITHGVSSADLNYNALVMADLIVSITDNDFPGVTIVESGGSTDVSELGPTSDTYTVVLDSEPLSNVTITATPDAQVDLGAGGGAAINLIFTAGNWNVAQTVTLTAVDDAIPEGTHASVTTHSSSSADGNFNGLAIPNVFATITDNDLPEVRVTESAGSSDVTEGGATDSYTIVLGTQPTADVIITVTPDSQTSVGAGGATPINLTFTSANWNVSQTVNLTAVDDALDEGPHNSTITHSATSGDAAYNAIAIVGVTANITDNDTAGITLIESAGTTDIAEGGANDSYTLVLDSEPTADVTITVAPDGQSDVGAGAGAPLILTFTAANWNTPQTVTVAALDDAIDEGAHNSIITHSVASADPKYAALIVADVVANVTDNDSAGVTISESAGTTDVVEGGATDSYTIVLDSEPTAGVTLTVNPDSQSDVGGGAGAAINLTFTSANWSTPQTVSVSAVDDALVEGPHTSTITHSTLSADNNYQAIGVANVVANVTDNDSSGVTIIESAGSTQVNETGPTSDSYTIVLDSQPTANVTLTVTPDIQTDLGNGPGTAILLTFTTANWNAAQTVTVTAVDDAVSEGPHSSTITHAAGSADVNYNAIAIPNVVASVNDNDVAGVTITQSAGSTDVAETGPTSDTYTITLNSEPTASVLVTVTPDSQVDLGAGAANPVALTFTAGNWNIPQTITVTAVDDLAAEGTHSSTISHALSSADGVYNGLPAADVTATITDNDAAGITVTQTGGGSAVSENGPTSDSYSIVLSSSPLAPVQIDITPDMQLDLGNGPATPLSLTFTSANWNAPQTVTITAVDDALDEGPHTGRITHVVSSADSMFSVLTIADITVNITDNDTSGIMLVESGGNTQVAEQGPTSDAYTIVLESQPTSDVTLTATPDAQLDLGGGPGVAVQFLFTPNDWNQVRTLTVTAVDDDRVEGPHSGTISHMVFSGDTNFNGFPLAAVSVQIGDNDSPGVIVQPETGDLRVSEAGPTSERYTVALTSEPSAAVTITATPEARIDLGAGPGMPLDIVFTSASWSVPRTVVATAVDDAEIQGTQRTTISHAISSADADYAGRIPGDVQVTVIDNDAPGVTVVESDDSTSVSENGLLTDSFSVALDAQPLNDVNVILSIDAQLDLGFGPGGELALLFTPSDWDIAQEVQVEAVDNNIAEPDHLSTIVVMMQADDPAVADRTVASVSVQIRDDDTAIVEEVTTRVFFPSLCGPLSVPLCGACLAGMMRFRCCRRRKR